MIAVNEGEQPIEDGQCSHARFLLLRALALGLCSQLQQSFEFLHRADLFRSLIRRF